MISTSRLTEKIQIEHKVTSQSSIGAPVEHPKNVYNMYASILTERGSTSFNVLPGNVMQTTISFFLRYTPIIEKKSCQVIYKGDTYRIIEVRHVQRNQATIVVCENVI